MWLAGQGGGAIAGVVYLTRVDGLRGRTSMLADVTVLIRLCGICGLCVQEFFEGYEEGGSVGIVADDVIRVPCIW
jgi:hypothetical protein